jgi:hypothetical protein
MAETYKAAQQKARLGAELDQLRTNLARAEQDLAELPALYAGRAELEAIKRSLSWRATAPLRQLRARLRLASPQMRGRLQDALAALLERLGKYR